MQITKNSLETAPGPGDWFTGVVFIDTIATPAPPSRVGAASVYFEPDEDHWHGAAPDRFMTHIAIQEADESGSPVTCGEHVTDAEYGA